jgi:hypothetical protein
MSVSMTVAVTLIVQVGFHSGPVVASGMYSQSQSVSQSVFLYNGNPSKSLLF